MPDKTEKPIPFVNYQESGQERLAGASPIAMNVATDGKGALMRRPGLTPATGIGSGTINATGVEAVYVTHGGFGYAVAGRRVYKLGSGGGLDLSPNMAQRVPGTARPVIAETEMLLAIAGGDVPQKVELANDACSRLQDTTGTGIPKPTHILPNGNRLVCNDTEEVTKVRYSGLAQGTTTFAGHEDWSVFSHTGGFFTAEARPDPVVAVAENTSEIFVFGSTNVEVYAQDPAQVYSKAAVREYGCGAPHSIINVDQQFAWLDHRRRLVLSDGRNFDDSIGEGIQQDLDSMSTIDDAFGFRFDDGPVDCMVWAFPTDGRTFSYQKGAGWSQWAKWDSGTNNWAPMGINCHFYRSDLNEHLVGTTDGKVLKLTNGLSADVGESVHSSVTTGYLSRGTPSRKLCKSVKLVFERGATTAAAGTSAPQAWLEWSDRPGYWSRKRALNIGVGGDTQPVVSLRSLGTYRERAWRITFSADVPLKLVSAIEEYQELEV